MYRAAQRCLREVSLLPLVPWVDYPAEAFAQGWLSSPFQYSPHKPGPVSIQECQETWCSLNSDNTESLGHTHLWMVCALVLIAVAKTSQRALCLCNPLKRQLFLRWSVPSCSVTDKSSVPSPAACGCLCRRPHPHEHLCLCPSPALGALQAGEQLHQPFCWPVALVLLPHSCSYWLICKELIKEHTG